MLESLKGWIIDPNTQAENESEREGWLLNSKDEDKLTGTNLGIVLTESTVLAP